MEDKDLEYYKENAEEGYIITPDRVLRYISESEKRIKELEALKDESRIQLEYLNEKFGETGTTNALLSRLK